MNVIGPSENAALTDNNLVITVQFYSGGRLLSMLNLRQAKQWNRLNKGFLLEDDNNAENVNVISKAPFCIVYVTLTELIRLRVVSNSGDRDCGAGEIHTRAGAKFRGDGMRGERQNFLALPSRRVSSKFRARARVYFARPIIAIAKI